MEFKIESVGKVFQKKFTNMEDIELLKELGFEFNEYTQNDPLESVWYRISGSPIIDFKSIEELSSFVKKYGECIICDDNTIKIYNDYYES